MFSIFKSKKSPLYFNENIACVQMLGDSLARTAVSEATKTEKALCEGGQDYRENSQQFKNISDAAFRYWIFHLYLIHRALKMNMNTYEDKDESFFVEPIFNKIYDLSTKCFMRLVNDLPDAKSSKLKGRYSEHAKEKLNELLELDFFEEKVNWKNKSNVLSLTLSHVFDDLAFETDYFFELGASSAEFKTALSYLDVYKKIFIKMRDVCAS